MWPDKKHDSAPTRVEIAGWVGFLLYVGLVYRPRRTA